MAESRRYGHHMATAVNGTIANDRDRGYVKLALTAVHHGDCPQVRVILRGRLPQHCTCGANDEFDRILAGWAKWVTCPACGDDTTAQIDTEPFGPLILPHQAPNGGRCTGTPATHSREEGDRG